MEDADADDARRRAAAGHRSTRFRVQESGLVKDIVVLDIPAEAGNFDTVLVRRAATKLQRLERAVGDVRDVARARRRRQAAAGAAGAEHAGPRPDRRGARRDLRRVCRSFGADSVRHVFGDHTTQKFGAWEVDWIEPQRVEDDDRRARARREGRDLDRLGLPARRGAGVVPAGEGPRRTSRSCSAGWCATRSPAASPATSGSTRSTASCRSSTARRPATS